MDWLLDRTTIITLAVISGITAVLLPVLRARGVLSDEAIRRWNVVVYVFMGASMMLFIIAGFYPVAPHAGN